MNIAIIPARGGSKRIPRKNIKLFCSKPIIAFSIETAQCSNCFNRIVVSTDDVEIAEVAKSFNAEVPFIRPDAISDDFATTIEVIQHAITELGLPDCANICCLYATAPFVLPEDLLSGLDQLQRESLDYVFGAIEFPSPIQRAFHLNQQGCIEMFQPEHFKTRSQDLEKAYYDAGQFYWGTCSAFQAGTPFFSSNAKPIIFPISRVQDIDTLEDWTRAELIYQTHFNKDDTKTK